MPLAAGQTIAVVVDGNGAQAGAFTLIVAQRQPDLAVETLSTSASTFVFTGEPILVGATVANRGAAAACRVLRWNDGGHGVVR